MPVPTTTQLQRLRSRPHRTRLWLGLYEPVTILSAQIDHPGITKGEMTIEVTTISGDINNVVSGMTCYIGSSAGAKDLGRIRVKDVYIIPGQVTALVLAENSRDWHENWFLTVVEYYEPWTVFPRIVLDDDNNDTWFKDYDIGYHDQNQILDPIVCMGPHHAGFLPSSGAYSVWYTSSGTQDPSYGATFPAGATYEWYFGPTGSVTPSGSSAADPGWITYHSSSFYTTRLTVTSAEGKSFTGYRHIMVYERPDEGPQRPIVEWGIENFGGSRDEGGYEVGLWIRERAGFSKVVDGALVVIWSEDWQDGVSGAIGGNAENRESILFVGYIQEDSISLDPVTNRLGFTAGNISHSMKDLGNYSVSLENTENAMSWWQIRYMTVDRAVIHLLRWHSTVLAVCDFHPTGDTKQLKYADFDRDALYDTAEGFLESTIGSKMVSDRQGKLWCEVDIHITPTGSDRDSTIPTLFDISRRDWRSEITFDRLFEDSTAYLELGGIGYAGPVTGSEYGEPYLAGAPGIAAGYRGGVDREQGLVLSSQEQLNILTGNWLARINATFPSVLVPIAGDYRSIDIAPQARLTVSLEADDTWRRLVWDEKRFVPVEIDYENEPGEQSLMMDLTLREETHGEIGITIEIPEEPPWDSPRDPWWDNPRFPPLPPLPPLPDPIPPPSDGDTVYVALTNRLARTHNFTSPYPSWERVGVATSGSMSDRSASWVFAGSIRAFELDFGDPKNTAFVLTSAALYKTTNLSAYPPTWSEIVSVYDLVIEGGHPTGSGDQMIAFRQVPMKTDYLAIHFSVRAGDKVPHFARSENGGGSWVVQNEINTSSYQDWPDALYVQEAMPGWGVTYIGSRQGSIKSVNAGDDGWSWMTQNSGTVGFLVPYHNNKAASGFYIGAHSHDETGKRVRRTMDNGFHFHDDTPLYNGCTWGPQRSAACIQWAAEWGVSDKFNYLNTYGIFKPNKSGWWTQSVLFKKVGWYAAWQFLAWFKGMLGGLRMHHLDSTKLYLLGRNDGGTPWDVDIHIGYSDDEGLSWAEKFGNWQSTIGSIDAPTNTRFYPIAIREVWID